MSQTQQQTASRRSSIRHSLKIDQCVNLTLSPSKLPLTTAKLKLATQRSKEVAEIFGEKPNDIIFSDLNFLKKDGNRSAIANIRVQDFNFLINNLIFLASKVFALESQASSSQPTPNQTCSQDITKLDLLSSKVCDLKFEISKNSDLIKSVDHKVKVAQNDFARTKTELEAAVEDKAELLEVEKILLENSIRMGHFEQHLENILSAGSQESTRSVTEATTQTMGQEKKVRFADEATQEVSQKAIETILLDESTDDMPSLEEDTPTKLARQGAATPPATPLDSFISEVVDEVVAEAVKKAKLDRNWSPGVNRSEKFDNHFSMVFFNCKIPGNVRRLETVRRLEREHIEAEGKSIYPQFHLSTVKYIQSLRPRGQSWSEPYNLKVVFKSEHVRRHMMDAAVYAGLLTRPHMSKRQFAQFQREQIARYSVSGTSTPGTPFLCNGGFQLQKPHPATEMNMKYWERRYWRHLGTNPLQKAYDNFKRIRSNLVDQELAVLNGIRVSGPSMSRAEDARTNARTASSASGRPLMRSFTSIYREDPDNYEWENPSPFPSM